MSEITIPVVTRLQDNGDGGYTLYVYNNNEELIADHPKFKNSDIEKSEKLKKQILFEYDPYTNGYIGTGQINLNCTDGKYTLNKKLVFSAGQ
jgi:hypothetical protein